MDRLRSLREEKGITQLRMSIEIGVAQETISGYELGKTVPNVETLGKLADFLGVSTDYLLERTNVRTPVSELTVDGLSSDERELVSLFRKLRPSERGKAVGFLMGVLER